MMRHIGKQILTIALCATLGAGHVLAASVVTTIVTDPLTGVALEGYDPVTYFIEPEPRLGSPDHAYEWGGVPWYFVSAANREVFMRAPEIYAPQHGGYCEMSLARGYLSDGKPKVYVVTGMKLYLFYSVANREAFLLSREAALAGAAENWSHLRTGLTGPETGASEPVQIEAAAVQTGASGALVATP